MTYLGRAESVDDTVRDVFLDDDNGRQFILAANGRRIYGNWTEAEPPDTPIVIAPENDKSLGR
jgi:hypothetical protein